MLEELRDQIRRRVLGALDGPLKAARAKLEPVLAAARAKLEPVLAPARARYQRLEPREKLLVRVAAAALAFVFVYDFIYQPFQDWREGLGDRIVARQRELAEVERMMGTYGRLKVELAATKSRTIPTRGDFSLFSVIEQSLTQTVGRDRIESITPSDKRVSDALTEYSVAIKLSGLGLGQVVDALYGVRNLSVPVAVSNLHVRRRYDNIRSYDVDLTCVTMARNG